jgi:NCAIR mutase (PurE)-related protein
MKQEELKNLLSEVAEGKVLPEQAAQRLKAMPYDDIGIARIDGHRELRTGRAEVIYGLGKTPEQVAKIMKRLSENSSPVIATKASAEAYAEAGKLLGDGWRSRAVSYGEAEEYLSAASSASGTSGATISEGVAGKIRNMASDDPSPHHVAAEGEAGAERISAQEGVEKTLDPAFVEIGYRSKELYYFRDAGLLVAVGGGVPGGAVDAVPGPGAFTPDAPEGEVAVLCAGTADIPIAEEAALTAGLYGCRVQRQYDVGVAGIHRLFSKVEDIKSADAVIVVAGMEGALPSVVGGLVSVPVVAVPTSIGYGVSMGGLTALFAMLSGCALGVSVVNIDNGFGAGYIASLIASQSSRISE